LCLVGVRYHGRTHIVEGNRRLWALREAEQRLCRPFEVKVDMQDLYIGMIHGRPALRMFWDKYTTENDGINIFLDEPAANCPCPVPQRNGQQSHEQHHEPSQHKHSQSRPNESPVAEDSRCSYG